MHGVCRSGQASRSLNSGVYRHESTNDLRRFVTPWPIGMPHLRIWFGSRGRTPSGDAGMLLSRSVATNIRQLQLSFHIASSPSCLDGLQPRTRAATGHSTDPAKVEEFVSGSLF